MLPSFCAKQIVFLLSLAIFELCLSLQTLLPLYLHTFYPWMSKFFFAAIWIILFFSASAMAQMQLPGTELFCDKKWYCEMTKDADGTIHPPDPGTENDYMNLRCDSTFTLIEAGIVLQGHWHFDSANMLLTLYQTQIATLPEQFSFHIIDQDESHLVIMGREGTTSAETAHLYTR